MKKQIVVVHGGGAFTTYTEYIAQLRKIKVDFEEHQSGSVGWKRNLRSVLSDEYEVVLLSMPNKMNAKYLEWEIWFEKFVPFLKDGVIFVGHSLGGIFLAKYLSEKIFPKKIKATFLIAAPFDASHDLHSLADFELPESLEKFGEQAGHIFLFQSRDDCVVPFEEVDKYAKALPQAKKLVFQNKNHFNQEEFPELVTKIRELPLH